MAEQDIKFKQPPPIFIGNTPLPGKDINRIVYLTSEAVKKALEEVESIGFFEVEVEQTIDANVDFAINLSKGSLTTALNLNLNKAGKIAKIASERAKIANINLVTKNKFTANIQASDDMLKDLAEVKLIKRKVNIAKELEENNIYTPDNSFGSVNSSFSKTTFLHKDIVDAVIDEESSPLLEKETLVSSVTGDKGKGKIEIRKLSSLFQNKRAGLPQKPKNIPGARIEKSPEEDPLFGSSFFGKIIPVGFPEEQNDASVLIEPGKTERDVVDDDSAYIPLSFTDLRALPRTRKLRSVFFRPIITSLSEDKSIEWNKRTLFGRTDQVVTYMSTIRTIFLNFELHAQYAGDVEIIYQKLNWLDSMCYPEYDSNFLMKSGPVLRMRVGDVISTVGGKGVAGVIDSLSYDYTESLWELKRNNKVPRSVLVSLSFHALHETPIGRAPNGQFGSIGRVDNNGEYVAENEVNGVSTVSSNYFRNYGNIDIEE